MIPVEYCPHKWIKVMIIEKLSSANFSWFMNVLILVFLCFKKFIVTPAILKVSANAQEKSHFA